MREPISLNAQATLLHNQRKRSILLTDDIRRIYMLPSLIGDLAIKHTSGLRTQIRHEPLRRLIVDVMVEDVACISRLDEVGANRLPPRTILAARPVVQAHALGQDESGEVDHLDHSAAAGSFDQAFDCFSTDYTAVGVHY